MAKAPIPPPIGERFGWLVVTGNTKHGRETYWTVRCDCGTEKPMRPQWLRREVPIVSCGCAWHGTGTDHQKFKHGDASDVLHGRRATKEYSTWVSIRMRASKLGIDISDRWMTFPPFLEDFGRAPTPRHRLYRRDIEGGFEPDNVWWLTQSEGQSRIAAMLAGASA